MTLRRKLVAYLCAVHVLLGAASVFAFRSSAPMLVVVEVVVIASLVLGISLVRSLLAPIERVRDGARFLADSDFTSRFRPTGDVETDSLIAVYNRMADHLREERTRNQEQNYLLEKILAASPVGVVTFDFDGRVAGMSPGAERLLGFSSANALGRTLAELDHPNAAALAAVATGQSEIVSLSGNRRVKCARGEFLDRGFPRAFLTLAELTEELRRSERAAYEKLIRVMSHEVNNTVASSTSLLQSSLTYARDLSPEDRTDFETALGVVIARTGQLNTFMKGFADVFRLPAPARQPCELVGILERVVALLSARPEAERMAWRWELDATAVRVSADPAQLEQAILNVVKNAVEAIGGDSTGGMVTIRVTSKTDPPTLVVEDSGAGLTAEAQANLFTPFFSTKPGGQGIGLTLVGEILAGHGFDYALERTDRGTTAFRITFS